MTGSPNPRQEVDGPELDENELMSQEEVYEQIQTLVKDNSGLQVSSTTIILLNSGI